MSKFKEILTKIDPEKKVLTEEVQNELSNLMESKEKTIKEEAMKEALALAEKKYAAINEENEKKIAEALEKQDAEHSEMLEKAVKTLDENHSKMLDTVVEALDTDHAAKFQKALDHVDADHTRKLRTVVEKYENVISKLRESVAAPKIVEAIDTFVDEYIREVAPPAKVVNEARLARLEKMYGQLREMVMVNDETFQTEIKEAVMDAKKIIDEKDAEIDKLMFDRIEMKKQISKIEAAKLLENKLKDVSPKMKAYLEVCFREADSAEIEERFDEAVKAYRSEEAKRRQTAVREADSKKTIKHPVTAKEDEIKPIIAEAKEHSVFDIYAGTVAKMKNASA